MRDEDAVKTVNIPLTETELISLKNMLDQKTVALQAKIRKGRLPSSTGLEEIDADSARRGLVIIDPIQVKIRRALAIV